MRRKGQKLTEGFLFLILSIAGLPTDIFPQQGIISTLAGGGPNSAVALSADITPASVAADTRGNLFIAGYAMHQVFKVDPLGNFSVVAGTGTYGFSGDGGPVTSASLCNRVGAGQTSELQGAAPQEKPPTFELQVQRNLVLVRAVVRDDKGRAVGGLRKEDFKLLDNGKVQAITHFSVETPAAPPVAEAKLAPPKTEPESGGPTAPSAITRWRYLGLFFDDFSLPFADFVHGRDAADRFVATALTPSDRVGIFTSSGLNTLDFTDDRAKLHEALVKLRPSNPRGYHPGEFPYLPNGPRGEHTPGRYLYLAGLRLQNLQHVVRRMATLPGQRSLILISDGFDISPQNLRMQSSAGEMADRALPVDLQRQSMVRGTVDQALPRDLLLQSLVGDVADRALRCNVIISALDPKGVPILMRELDASWAPPPGGGGGAQVGEMHMRASSRESAASGVLAQLAKDTGGEFFHHDNDLDAGFAKVAATPEVYYTLAFSPQDLKNDGSFHILKVGLVNNAGLSVAARRGYLEPRKLPGANGQVNEEIEAASFSLDELKELPVNVHTQFFKGENGEAQLSVLIHLDLGSLRFRKEQDRHASELIFVAVLFDRDGKYLDGKWKRVALRLHDSTLEKLRVSGIDQKISFAVKPGAYLIREVVQDSAEGHLAALNSIVEIPF